MLRCCGRGGCALTLLTLLVLAAQIMYAIRTRSGSVYMMFKKNYGDMSALVGGRLQRAHHVRARPHQAYAVLRPVGLVESCGPHR